MKKLLTLICAAAMLMTFGLSSGCSNDDNVLIMATESGFAPFEYVDGGDIIGIDVEIMEAVAEKLGKTLRIDDVPFTSVLTNVAQGKADVGAAGITINDKRKLTNDFSNPYFNASQYILVNSTDTTFDGLTTAAAVEEKLASLTGKKAGVQGGTTSELYLEGEDDPEGFPGFSNITVNPYEDGSFATAALRQGTVDMVLIDEQTGRRLVSLNEGVKIIEVALTEEQYGFAVKKGNQALLNTINEVLDELRTSGKLQEIFDRHIFGELE